MNINKINKNTALVEDKYLVENKNTCANNITPIDVWSDLIHSNKDDDTYRKFRNIYKAMPLFGEIIFNSNCKFNCRHCIYSSDYNKYNLNISSDQWKKIIKSIYDDISIRKFVNSGRSVNDTVIEVLRWMRESFTNIEIGMIDNGISMLPYLNVLPDLQLDWIDISIDGMEKEHDFQRNQVGSFKKVLSTVSYLKEKHIVPKINILICLTKSNKDSVIDLIKFMNEKGFKNFFISPITAFSDYGPTETLKVVGRDFIDFIKDLIGSLHMLKDTWIELNIFDLEYMRYIKECTHELQINLKPEYDHLSWDASVLDNNFYINYFPLSLNGIREFVVNSNGDSIFPLVMRKGLIPEKEVIGNLISQGPLEILGILRDLKLDFYLDALFEEKKVLA